ncbi:MAG: hypothetical protein LBM96_03525 [Methanobrevibacter sp.]|jgi:hypothetical protein|nr:hypothetical protein [Candidatus Methanoflexus mossambicus]
MTKYKILAPSNALFNQDYKLSYFSESLSQYEENQVEFQNNNVKRHDKLKKWFRKIFYIFVCLNLFVLNVTRKMLIKMELKEKYFIFMIKVK